MAVFTITRKQFLDRALDADQLLLLADMLRRWYLIRTANSPTKGQLILEARVYAFPRLNGDKIRRSFEDKLTGATFDLSDPDELRIISSPQAAEVAPDTSIWTTTLTEPTVENTCLMLRMTFIGQVPSANGLFEDSVTTFVLCGVVESGALLLKAMWSLGSDESLQLIYRHVVWDKEKAVLGAFDFYVQQRDVGTPDANARLALGMVGKAKRLFISNRQQRKIIALTRHWAELPDQRTPLAFARRVGLTTAVGVLFASMLIGYHGSVLITFLCGFGAIYCGGMVLWMVFKKIAQVAMYYFAMRRGLGAMYSGPINRRQIDLSEDKTPTLLKYSAELSALGARHICDVCINTARMVLDGNRIYTLDTSVICLGLLRKAGNRIFFPPRPVLIVSTRFKNGWRHGTLNHPQFRKKSIPNFTGRCLPNDGGLEETLALHHRHIDKIVAASQVALPVPNTPKEVLEQMDRETEESRQAWKKNPYSWSDALHNAFKVCRREYLKD